MLGAFEMFTFARKAGQVLGSPETGNLGTGPDAKRNFGGYVVYQAILIPFIDVSPYLHL